MDTASIPDAAMDNALSIARSLYQKAEQASKLARDIGAQPDLQALQDIRSRVGALEAKVREAKIAPAGSRNELIQEVGPLRLKVIEACRQHQHAVQDAATKDLIQTTLDWCELKDAGANSSGSVAAPGTPAYRVPSPQGAHADAAISCSPVSLSNDANQLNSFPLAPAGADTDAAAAAADLAAARQPGLAGALGSQQLLPAIRTASKPAISTTLGLLSTVAPGAALIPAARHQQAALGPRDQQDTWQQPQQQQECGWAGQAAERPSHSLDAPSAVSSVAGAGALGRIRFLNLDPASRSDGTFSSSLSLNRLQQSSGSLAAAGRYQQLLGADDEAQAAGGPLEPQGLLLRGKQHNIDEAAMLAAAATKVHVFKDAVRMKTCSDDALVDVPRVPACLAVGKRRTWGQRLLRLLAGAAVVAATGAAAAAANAPAVVTGVRRGGAASGAGNGDRVRGSKSGAKEPCPGLQLPFAPVGPAPDASAGCG